MADDDRRVVLTLSGDIHLKSSRTRRRFMRILRENLTATLRPVAPSARLAAASPGRITLTAEGDGTELLAALDVAATTFGVHRAELMRCGRASTFDDLVATVAAACREEVAGRTFAVRVRRHGDQPWKSPDAEREIGTRLRDAAAGVDLTRPEVTVRVDVWDDEVSLVERRVAGPGGLPLRTQPAILSLLSGGFDSPVASWLMMRRGSPVDFVHFTMDCAQTEHALAVAYELWRRWGAGTRPRVWIVEFREVKQALLDHVVSAQRQVVLKQLMFRVADALARREQLPALVTGESVGQVSTQTIANLAEIDRVHSSTVLRPLAGFSKDEIVDWARRIGTHDLSARAKEVCDLATGPVDVATHPRRLARATATLPNDLVERALESRRVIALPDWHPGLDIWSAYGVETAP
jgi:thiamine biosynthesis protein ThiI